MNRKDLTNEEKSFLELIARNVWQARREGAIVGCLYTLGIVGLSYRVVQTGYLNSLSVLWYSGILVIVYDAQRRIFKKP